VNAAPRIAALIFALVAVEAGAQERECPDIKVGVTTYGDIAGRLEAAGIRFQQVRPDEETGNGRGIFVKGAPLCPGFGRPGLGTMHFFAPGSNLLAAMVVNFRYAPDTHWALEQFLDERFEALPAAARARPTDPDTLAPVITKAWSRDGIVVRLRQDAPDVPPMYSGVEYLRPDIVADMEAQSRRR
jgi:hypothetical protein